MSRTIFAFLFLVAFILPLAAQSKRHSRTPPARSVEQTIADLEQQWLLALVQRDQATVASILAPDFHDTTMNGQVRDRQQALAAVLDTTRPDFQRSFGRIDVQSYDARFAVARGIVLISGPNIRRARIAFTDVFVLHDAKWQAVAAQEALVQQQ